MPPRHAADVLHDLFCRFLHRPGFQSHLRSLKGYDEPEILPSSTRRNCLIGADAGHDAQNAERAGQATPPLSAIEPVSATAKRKLDNGEQRPAPEAYPRNAARVRQDDTNQKDRQAGRMIWATRCSVSLRDIQTPTMSYICHNNATKMPPALSQ